MKILLCHKCTDFFSLTTLHVRKCLCGAVSGSYSSDGLNAVVEYTNEEEYSVLGISNPTLVSAIRDQMNYGDLSSGLGRKFDAFVIPMCAPTVKREKKK